MPNFTKLSVQHVLSLAILWLSFIVGACQFAATPAPTSGPPSPTPTPVTISSTLINSGLDQLDSYRANLTLDFSGTLVAEPDRGHIETLTEVTRQPAARHRYLNVTGNAPLDKIVSGVSEFYQVDTEIYLRRADEGHWSQFSIENSGPEQLNFLEPERLMVLPTTVTSPPQTETLYGLPVEHYHFNEADLTGSQFIFTAAQGELWVAIPGDYLVQYTLTATLTAPLLEPKAHFFDEGTMTLHYTLADINSDFTITPPDNLLDSSHPLSNLPRPADAQILSLFPTLLEYTTTISPISATLFYRSQLPDLAWQEDAITVFNEKANLSFSKEEQTLAIIISPLADDHSKVVLNFKPR
jgi:hypothetical protein